MNNSCMELDAMDSVNALELEIPNEDTYVSIPTQTRGKQRSNKNCRSYLSELRGDRTTCLIRGIGFLQFVLGACLFLYCAVDTAHTHRASRAFTKQCAALGIQAGNTSFPHQGKPNAASASKHGQKTSPALDEDEKTLLLERKEAEANTNSFTETKKLASEHERPSVKWAPDVPSSASHAKVLPGPMKYLKNIYEYSDEED